MRTLLFFHTLALALITRYYVASFTMSSYRVWQTASTPYLISTPFPIGSVSRRASCCVNTNTWVNFNKCYLKLSPRSSSSSMTGLALQSNQWSEHGNEIIRENENRGAGEAETSTNAIDNLVFRPVHPDDITDCYNIEAASYPEDEAATLEKLRYRQQFAGDYFWCATLSNSNETINKSEAGERNSKKGKDVIVGFMCSTRCHEFTDKSMSTHDASGRILAVHSVVVESQFRRQGVASAMMKNYLQQMVNLSDSVAASGPSGIKRISLLAKSHLLGFYVKNGFMVLRPSPIVHGRETWYELEARKDYLERLFRFQVAQTDNLVHQMREREGTNAETLPVAHQPRPIPSSRSTTDPDYEGGSNGSQFVEGRDQRRTKLHVELTKLGIDPKELESYPHKFGTAAIRTYNSFLLPKSKGAWAVAESPTRACVVANSMSFLIKEFKANHENWLRNYDKEGGFSFHKHPITIILDNVRSAYNVGNILRLAEASQVDSVRLCGMTPRPPHPKVLKTAMGSAPYVSLGKDESQTSLTTADTVQELKRNGVRVFGVETAENATLIWDSSIPDEERPTAYVFGNELIGVDVEVLRECDEIIYLPMYGMKNSLNIANCVSVVVWETLRRWHKQ